MPRYAIQFVIFTPYSYHLSGISHLQKELAFTYLYSSGYIDPLKYQSLLRERVRESASQKWAKRQRGSPRLNSKKLSPALFCRWRQNPRKNNQHRTNALELEGQRPRDSFTLNYMGVFWGSGERGGLTSLLGWGRVLGCKAAAPTVPVCCSVRHSGTVDVQRLAVLPWSMEHAEAHTFFQGGRGVAMGTHGHTPA